MGDGRSDVAYAWLREAVADPASELSFGAFGAVGLFRPGGSVPSVRTTEAGFVAETSDAALRIERDTGLVPVAFEILSSDPTRWNHGVALCAPADRARMAHRAALTPLGPDASAIRAADRDAALFDLGLEASNADVCVRTADEGLSGTLMARARTAVAFPDIETELASADWIFATALGRLEIRSPDRRFVVPKLIAGGLSHAATTPVPQNLVPCGYLFPSNPSRSASEDPFDHASHDRFQALLRRFGPPELVALKLRVEQALARGDGPEAIRLSADPHRRATVRVTLRQRRRLAPDQDLSAWLAVFDRPALNAAAASNG